MGVRRSDSSSGGPTALTGIWGFRFFVLFCFAFVGWLAVELEKNRVTFPGFWGWFGFFSPLGLLLGGTFVLWT